MGEILAKRNIGMYPCHLLFVTLVANRNLAKRLGASLTSGDCEDD